jgi:hypothetical protein
MGGKGREQTGEGTTLAPEAVTAVDLAVGRGRSGEGRIRGESGEVGGGEISPGETNGEDPEDTFEDYAVMGRGSRDGIRSGKQTGQGFINITALVV